jgi:hypothetical protein
VDAVTDSLVAPITLWIPKPPDNANGAKGWRTVNRKKKALLRELDTRKVIRLLPPAPDHPLERYEVLVEWHYPNRRHLLDDDNVYRRLKPVIDWLVTNRYLMGDTSAHLTWRKPVTIIGAETPPLSTVRLTLIPNPIP